MIAHELCTALVGRDGRIVEIWRGNEWTPEEALNAVQTRVATQADG
jgi:protein SCO1/2